MKKLIVVLFLGATLAGFIYTVRQFRASLPNQVHSGMKVDLDFTALSETIRSAKVVELSRDLSAFADKSLRLNGVAAERKSDDGQQAYGLFVYDAGGCCPLFVVEYRPSETNSLPEVGRDIIVEGILKYEGPQTNATVYIGDAKVFTVSSATKNSN